MSSGIDSIRMKNKHNDLKLIPKNSNTPTFESIGDDSIDPNTWDSRMIGMMNSLEFSPHVPTFCYSLHVW